MIAGLAARWQRETPVFGRYQRLQPLLRGFGEGLGGWAVVSASSGRIDWPISRTLRPSRRRTVSPSTTRATSTFCKAPVAR